MDGGKYINPYTDYGFKYLFGTEPNKDLTLHLVNDLLQGREVIKSLTLLSTEQLGDTEEDRRSVFDVYCENEKGDKIIIEMLKAEQQWFKDRSVYYSSFPIRSQGEKGKWLFGLKAVYTGSCRDKVRRITHPSDSAFQDRHYADNPRPTACLVPYLFVPGCCPLAAIRSRMPAGIRQGDGAGTCSAG